MTPGWGKALPMIRALARSALPAFLLAATAYSDTRATSGTLIITADTTLAEDHHGDIQVRADGVTLDCAGHRVVGPGQGEGILIERRTGVAVRNCRVSGFFRGILVIVSSEIALEGNRAEENEYGIWIGSDHVSLFRNTAADNRETGFFLGGATDFVLTENTAIRNGHNGFSLLDSDRNSLSNNLAEDNGTYGFALGFSHDNILENNVARRNEAGFHIEKSRNVTLNGNLASDNRTHGIRLELSARSLFLRNTATGNGIDGFNMFASSDIVLSGNRIVRNGQRDVEIGASTGVVLADEVGEDEPRAGADTGVSPGTIGAELVSFLGLASALWLGIYLVSRPSPRPVTWLAALALWSVGGAFVDDLIDLMTPTIDFSQVMRESFSVWPTISAVFWFHATCLMLPGGVARPRKALLVVGYLMAAAVIALQIFRPGWVVVSGRDALLPNTSRGGLLFLPLAAGLLLVISLSVINLVRAAREARLEILRRQFGLLIASTLISGISGPLIVLSTGFGWSFPTIIGASVLLAGVVLLGYGVARYSAIVEGRTLRRQFAYSLVSVGVVTLLYIIVSYLSSLTFGVRTAAYAFVILLAVITHSVVGSARTALDTLFFRPYARAARRNLGRLVNEAGDENHMTDRLTIELDYACTQVRASFGLVVLADDGRVQVAAAHHWTRSTLPALRLEDLAPEDVLQVKPGSLPSPLEAATLIAPLHSHAESFGAMVLGHPLNGTTYSPDEIELLAYTSDRMVDLIREDRARISRLTRLAEEVRPATNLDPGSPSLMEVEDALKHIQNFAYLGAHPLCKMRLVRSRTPAGADTHLDLGRVTHQVLVEAIEKFKPAEPKPLRGSWREWYPYMILHEAYVKDRPNREIMAELNISEGSFNRTRRAAILALTRLLGEWELAEEASPKPA